MEAGTEAFISYAGTLGSKPGLANIQNLMGELSDIQEKIPVIQIVGTNGKGSVGAMLAETLKRAGYRTGHYSSPAVFCEEERYRINGEQISTDRYEALLTELSEVCGRMTKRGLPHPTLFEIETALAFLYFYRAHCQVVIMEAGMGGTLDATNVVSHPLLCIVTSVSMDHMAFLGNTLSEIARQKAGIIRPHTLVASTYQKPEVHRILQEVCREKHAILFDPMRWEEGHTAALDSDGSVILSWGQVQNVRLSLKGSFQYENAVCVLQACQALRSAGYEIEDETIRQALMHTSWPGRFEVVSKDPLIVMDGAHNEDAAGKLAGTVRSCFTNRRIIGIMGVFRDKEHEKILAHLLPLLEKLYTVTAPGERGLSGELLCREAQKLHGDCVYAGSIREGLERAIRDAKEEAEMNAENGADRNARNDTIPDGQDDAMILIFGSLSFLGEVKRILAESHLQPARSSLCAPVKTDRQFAEK